MVGFLFIRWSIVFEKRSGFSGTDIEYVIVNVLVCVAAVKIQAAVNIVLGNIIANVRIDRPFTGRCDY